MADYTNPRTNSLPDPASPGFRDGDTISLQNGSRFSRQNGRWEPIAFQSGSAESPLTVRISAQGVREKLNFSTKPKSTQHIFCPSLQPESAANDATGKTFRAGKLSKSQILAIGMIAINESSSPIVISDIKVATNTVLSSTLNASVSNEWISVGGMTVPVKQGTGQPTIIISPLGRVYAQEATAYPGHFLGLVSCRIDAAQTTYYQNTQDLTWMASEDPAGGMHWALREAVGDRLTSPGTFASTTPVGKSPIVGMVLLCADGAVNIMFSGDSATSGAVTWGGNVGESDGFIATRKLNASGVIAGYINAGYGGQNTTISCARAQYLIGQIKPNVVAISAGSPNDGTPSAIGISLIKQNILAVEDAQIKAGGEVIYRGWMPTSNRGWAEGVYTNTATGTTPGDVYRRAQNAWAKARDSRRTPYAEGYAALGNGAAPELYAPAYTVDNDHPGPAGRELASSSVLDVLAEVAARYYD